LECKYGKSKIRWKEGKKEGKIILEMEGSISPTINWVC
jgi:hypothetical protein